MKRTVLVFSFLSLAMLILAIVLVKYKKEETVDAENDNQKLLCERRIDEIEEIRISNKYNTYSVNQIEGGFAIADLPMELVFPDYLLMLLDEAARVEYSQLVSRLEKNADDSRLPFGLDNPECTVVISYTKGEPLTLVFGNEEPVSRGRYFTAEGTDAVYLMDRSRVVRFLQPIERFINMEIVPSRSVNSPLSTIKKLTLSGRSFPRPVAINAIDLDNEEEVREALGFGSTTHVITSPHLHKIDQGEAIDVFASLSGLLNIDVLNYKASDAELGEYGLSDPLVKAEYDYLKGDGSSPVTITLKTALYKGDYVLVRDDQRVVHRVEKKPFITTSYEKLVSRWFLTPFITDVRSIDLRFGDKGCRFELLGEDNRSLEATLNGVKLDTGLFRKFYNLLVSASGDGLLLETPPESLGPPVLAVTFFYRDPLKESDLMIFSPGSLRRHFVTVNGVTEFACLQRYAQTVEAALAELERGEDFMADW